MCFLWPPVFLNPWEVFADPITNRATAVIIAHNHPSGDITPSEDDKKVTQDLKSAGKLLGSQFLDHIILSHKDHYSFPENGAPW
jgi:DNA repair protein RadC